MRLNREETERVGFGIVRDFRDLSKEWYDPNEDYVSSLEPNGKRAFSAAVSECFERAPDVVLEKEGLIDVQKAIIDSLPAVKELGGTFKAVQEWSKCAAPFGCDDPGPYELRNRLELEFKASIEEGAGTLYELEAKEIEIAMPLVYYNDTFRQMLDENKIEYAVQTLDQG